jgi:CHAT domain-containing protein/predicted negative regulator of RcsB-dependent stress response
MVKHFTFCFVAVFILLQTAYAFEAGRQEIFRVEREAKRLGKIWNGEEIRRSILLFKEAAENRRKAGEYGAAAECLRRAAELSFMLSDYDSMRTALEQAVRFDQTAENVSGRVYTDGLFARYFERTGNIAAGERHSGQALKLSETLDAHPQAFANLIAGEIEFSKVDLEKAGEFFREALNFAEKTSDSDLTAEVLTHLAAIDAAQGKIDPGLKLLNEARNLFDQTGNQRGLAILYNRYGLIHLHSGDKLAALENYRKAEAMFPENVDPVEKGISLSGSGALYFHYRRLDLAESFHLKALENHQLAGYLNGQLAVYPGLIKINYLNGKIEPAKKLIIEALDLGKREKNEFFLAGIREEQALINFAEGNYDEAVANLELAQTGYENSSVNVTRVLNSLGQIYERQGDLPAAREKYLAAEKKNRAIRDDLELSESLFHLARLCRRENDFETALEKSEESVSLSEDLFHDVGSHNLQGTFLSNIFERYELYINLLMEEHRRSPGKGFEIKALQAAENVRSRLMLENLQFSGADFLADADPLLVTKESDLNRQLISKKEFLSELLNNDAEKKEISKLETEIAVLDNELQLVKFTLRRDSPIYSSVKNRTAFDHSDFQKNVLDENTLLIEFFTGREKSFLWLIGQNEVITVELPAGRVIDGKIERLLELLLPEKSPAATDIREYQKKRFENERNYWSEAKELSELLFGRIAGKIKDKRLIIVPDGKLRVFPVDALPIPGDPENKPLLLSNEIIYEPSATMFRLIKSKKNPGRHPAKDFMIYSDPVFSNDDARLAEFQKNNPALNEAELAKNKVQKRGNNLIKLERLDGAAGETEAIFEYFSRKNSRIVDGFAAKREYFLKEDFTDYKILHLATHGIFNENFPELSGVVLSQYDQSARALNGSIWLQDIYGLKLNADLVVLSACDTGIGQEMKGEGLLSLSNAFLQVGAETVIASHWKVEDEATSRLMKDFYRILAEQNVSSSEAIRRARIAMYEDPNYSFPYYWASFTPHGDYRIKPLPRVKFAYRNYLYLLLPVIIAFGFYRVYESANRKSI